MAYYGIVTPVDTAGAAYTTANTFNVSLHADSTQTCVTRPYWGCSSTATSTDADSGTTGLWWSATYIDLLGKGAASSSSSFDHITAPASTVKVHYYDIIFSAHTATTGELYLQRWPSGSTASTLRQILSTGGDITVNKLYQLTVGVSAGEEFTIGMSAAASTGQFSLFIEPSNGNRFCLP